MELTLFSVFVVGLFSTLHCLGMCGGIIGALTFSLPADVRADRWRLGAYVAAYNTGRIASYAVAGALAGGLGSGLVTGLGSETGRLVLLLLATAFMVGIGLYLAGWFPRFAAIERIGKPLWRRLEPLGQRLLPVNSPWQALLFGAVWGWLPCGLVYSVLLWAITAGGALPGALFMLAFGVGTLPATLTAGIVTGWMTRFSRTRGLRQTVGVLLILLALLSFGLNLRHAGHVPPLSNPENPRHEHVH
ncbi:MAG TPA: sulfite exporter TauE/SafE family protein [Gammaproteobacteria bacterium]|nr:sulfite exporter TauE/SafE family protein [Gammaproteobacteria bacterium]